MTQINKECLARTLAVIDGKVKQFDDCKNDIDLEELCGYYEGYLTDAEQLITQYEKELENREN